MSDVLRNTLTDLDIVCLLGVVIWLCVSKVPFAFIRMQLMTAPNSCRDIRFCASTASDNRLRLLDYNATPTHNSPSSPFLLYLLDSLESSFFLLFIPHTFRMSSQRYERVRLPIPSKRFATQSQPEASGQTDIDANIRSHRLQTTTRHPRVLTHPTLHLPLSDRAPRRPRADRTSR